MHAECFVQLSSASRARDVPQVITVADVQVLTDLTKKDPRNVALIVAA